MSLESTANLQQLPQMPAESRMTASCSRVVTTDHSHLHPLSERASASQVGVRASAACMDGGGVTSPLWLQQLGSRTHPISGRVASNGAPSALSRSPTVGAPQRRVTQCRPRHALIRPTARRLVDVRSPFHNAHYAGCNGNHASLRNQPVPSQEIQVPYRRSDTEGTSCVSRQMFPRVVARQTSPTRQLLRLVRLSGCL